MSKEKNIKKHIKNFGAQIGKLTQAKELFIRSSAAVTTSYEAFANWFKANPYLRFSPQKESAAITQHVLRTPAGGDVVEAELYRSTKAMDYDMEIEKNRRAIENLTGKKREPHIVASHPDHIEKVAPPPGYTHKDIQKIGDVLEDAKLPKPNDTPMFKNGFDKFQSGVKPKLQDIYMKLKRLPMGVKVGAAFFASISALSYARERALNSFSSPSMYLPETHENAYNVIKQELTDFGSPFHLSKIKAIMPRYSSVRSGIATNINTVLNKNDALFMYKNAIKHTRY